MAQETEINYLCLSWSPKHSCGINGDKWASEEGDSFHHKIGAYNK